MFKTIPIFSKILIQNMVNRNDYFLFLFFVFFRIGGSAKLTTIVAQEQESTSAESSSKGHHKMGRKKIQISRICDERNRQVNYQIQLSRHYCKFGYFHVGDIFAK